MNRTIAKFFYGFFFCVILPGILFLWASQLTISLPSIKHEIAGIVITVWGVLFIVFGMLDLYRYGRGLPMNAFPPEAFVSKGSYKLVRHPIYTGFCIACAGVSIIYGSASGFYVITPVMIILCASLVIGYEEPDLIKRFGNVNHRTLFGLPEHSEKSPEFVERVGAFLSAFVPWIIFYEIFIQLGTASYWVNTMLPVERSWPVIQWMEIFYASTYVIAALCPFIASSKSNLREFILCSWWCTALGIFCFFVFPFYASARPLNDPSWLGNLIMLERSLDGPTAAFPSFHVLWTLIAFTVWSDSFPKLRWLWIILSMAIVISCVAVGIHSIADVLAAGLIFLIVVKREPIYSFVERRSEGLANSWKETNIGGFRIINHSLYAGLAAAAGIFIASQFSIRYEILLLVTGLAILGGGVWGQWIEGSSKMLRPFGYYGALLGSLLGVLLSAWIFDLSFFLICSVFALAAPLTQAIGRLRCLVQGCCHGAISISGKGIRYTNEHSRVCKMSGLKGVPLHNTQLYSMVFNGVIALILFRLWLGGSAPSLIAGMYFILSGAARFVEEAYRGETQTRIIGGLRLYQWLAIAAILAGMIMTAIPSHTVIIFKPMFTIPVILSVLVSGLGWAFAMGMDFPRSTIRFSRLTG